MSVKSASRGFPVITLLDELTTGTSDPIAIPSSFTQHKITVKGSAGVSAGKVQPESASESDYDGTWNPVGGGSIDVVADAEVEYNFEGIYQFLRVDISDDVVGGTVTVTYVGS